MVWCGMEESWSMHEPCHGIQWWYRMVLVTLCSYGSLVALFYCNRIDIVQCGWMMSHDLYALCRHAESMGETRYY